MEMLSLVPGLVGGSSPVARPMAHPLRGWTVASEHDPAASIGECSCSETVSIQTIAKVDWGAFIGGSVSPLDVSKAFCDRLMFPFHFARGGTYTYMYIYIYYV